MILHLRITFAALFCFLFALSVGAQVNSFEKDLEKALSETHTTSVEQLLSNPEAQRVYFEALVQNLDPAITRDQYAKAYNAILDQLRQLLTLDTTSALSEKIFRYQPEAKKIEVESSVAISGRAINKEAFEKYVMAEIPLSRLNETEFAFLREKVRARLAQIPSAELGKQIRTLKTEPEFINLAKVSLTRWLDTIRVAVQKDITADELLYHFWQANQKAKTVFPELAADPVTLTLIKEMLPTPKLLLQNSEVLPILTRGGHDGKRQPVPGMPAGTVVIETSSRLFHSFFRGMIIKECVGGACEHLDKLTPMRWALGLLDDARILAVSRGGSFLGYITAIGTKLQAGPFAVNADFGHYVLAQKILTRDGWQRLFDIYREYAGYFFDKTLTATIQSEASEHYNGTFFFWLREQEFFKNAAPVSPELVTLNDQETLRLLQTAAPESNDPRFPRGKIWMDYNSNGSLRFLEVDNPQIPRCRFLFQK